MTLSSNDVEDFKDDDEFGTETDYLVYYLQFNFLEEHFDNKNIRKAFQLAFDREVLTETVLNNGSESGKGLEKIGELPAIELLSQDDTVAKDTATFLQNAFKENLGVDIDLVTKPFSVCIDAMRDSDFKMDVTRWGSDYNGAIYISSLWCVSRIERCKNLQVNI